MFDRRQTYWKPFIAVAVAIGIALVIELTLVTPSVANVISLLCANGVVAVVATFVWDRHGNEGTAAISSYLHNLTELENDLHTQLPDPPVTEESDLFQPLLDVREKLDESVQRVSIAESARTAAEIRAVRAEERLNRFQEIMAGLSTPILAIDHFEEVVLANRSAETLFQMNLEATEERAIDEVLKCHELVNLLRGTRRRRSNRNRNGEIEWADKNGDSLHFKVSCRSIALGNSGDEHRGAVAILYDVSGERVIQKRHAEFVSAVSHEMKTPLSGIKAYVELLADGDAEDEETQEEFLDVINSQADRLQRLIDNMLNISRIEAGVVQVSKSPQSLNEILEEAFSVVEPTAEKKNIKLVPELSAMYVGVLADRDLLLQAAINLLSNAIKYTPEGGEVVLRSRIDGEIAIFEVEDTGVGLSDEDCNRVFEKFYRVKKDHKMAAGTGLGLPLVKHIVEDVHGGHLAVNSVLGEGSTFGVQLTGVASMSIST